MKENTVIILIVAGAALLFWAVSTGLIKTTGGLVNVGGGVLAPQPSQNYGGYLAVSSAPAVAGALSTAISGLGNAFSGWLGSPTPAAKTAQGANPSSPSGAAQPSGPSPQAVQSAIIGQAAGTGAFTPTATYASYSDTLVGPQVSSQVAYSATPGSAFDYAGLASDNSFDPDYSLSV